MSKLTWTDVKESSAPKNRGDGKKEESPYIELKEGDNYVRITNDTDFYGIKMYYAYGKYQKSADDFDAVESICPLAKEFDEEGKLYRARPYFLFEAIERSTDKLKVLRVGKQLFDMMKLQASKEKWGSLTNYDLCITRRAKGENPLYLCSPEPKSPLTATDKEIIANKTVDIEKLARPALPKWVQTFIDANKPGAQQSRGAQQQGRSANTETRNSKPRQGPSHKEEPQVDDEFLASESVDDIDNI